MVPTSALLETLASQGIPTSDGTVQKAIKMAETLYGDLEHWTGVTLLEHTFGVLRLLLPFQPDTDAMCACVLQHALRTRKISLLDIEEEFGTRVRSLVSGVHLLSHVTMRHGRSSIEELRLMLLSVSDDIRVLLIILCDRCYVLEHVENLPAPEARRAGRDVLNLFAPVAARLGIHALKQRLESLAFPLVYRSDAERIAEQMTALKEHYGSFLDRTSTELQAALLEQGIDASVHGREKQLYSIFLKLKAKSLSHIEDLPDLFAVRVLVETDADCYRALGLLHRLGRPVANRFKDYIAVPKPNGYRSLHTTISRLPGVPEGVFIEVQVRSYRMHREAEYGIAAHWSYKEGGQAERQMQRVQLQQMLTSQQSLEGHAGIQRLADHIFVLTPKGDIVELPEGATPLDFAFQIHTDLGLSFRSARVNGSIVPMDYELENGDVIEILTHRVPRPSPEWLHLLAMASSRSRLRRYLHSMDRGAYVERGKELVNDALAMRGLPALDTDLSIMRSYRGRMLDLEEREDLLMKIGQGADRAGSVILHLDTLPKVGRSARKTSALRSTHATDISSPVKLEGNVPMPLRFAKCCSPLKGDRTDIRGFISRTGDVMIHRAKCRMIKTANPERRVGVTWKD